MSLRAARIPTVVLAIIGIVCAIAPGASAQPMGKSKEYRSLNSDLYKIAIQKNGQLDVFLANDMPVIVDVFPMIWFDGEAGPERLKMAGRWTERLAIEDKLGQGQGIVHYHKGWQWSLRAYPTRPYFAVQLAYTNETKKSVRIKALLPWCVGVPGKGMLLLGPGTNDARILTGVTSGAPVAAQGAAQSEEAAAILNATTGQSLIAGFITQDRARGSLDIGKPVAEEKNKSSGLGYFRAISTFNEPVELAPGETLNSEVLYLSISEPDPVVGLQRYARAVQIANGLSGPGHDTPLHAWVISTDNPPAIDELAQQLRRAKADVPLKAIHHVLIGSPDSPAQTIGTDPQFVALVRAEGFTPVLWFDPLAGGPDSAANLSPEAQRAAGARIRKTYGAVSVAGLRVEADGPPEKNTNIETLRAAYLAFREGLGPDAQLYGAAPSLLAATLFDGVISDAADGQFLSPQPARHSVFFKTTGGEDASFRARLSAAALMNCGLLIPLARAGDAATTALISRVLPSSSNTARPIDLFAAQAPRAFHLHTKTADGEVDVAAVMNWTGETPLSMALPLARFGFAPGAFYTVYDYWRQRYLGTAADTLDITVPAGDATVLVFRPFLGHPMLVSTGANFGQDSPALRRVEWDPLARTLNVELAEAATTEAARRFTLAVPAPYRMIDATSTTPAAVTWEATGASATVIVPADSGPPQGFTVRFVVDR